MEFPTVERFHRSSAIILALVCAAAPPLEAREFIGRNGKKIDAEIVSKTDSQVELELADGKKVTVPISSLSDADQLFVKVWESATDKKARLAGVNLADALEAKGYVPFAITLKDGAPVVSMQIDGKEAKFLIDHRNPQPILNQASVEKLGLTMKAAPGGGQVLGTINPKELGNGSATVKGVEFYVVALNQMPEGIDGLIGGAAFTDWEAFHDFAGAKVWLKGK